jgi:hypothetical protein
MALGKKRGQPWVPVKDETEHSRDCQRHQIYADTVHMFEILCRLQKPVQMDKRKTIGGKKSRSPGTAAATQVQDGLCVHAVVS